MPANYGDRPCQDDSAADEEGCGLDGFVAHCLLTRRWLNTEYFMLKHTL